MAAIDAITPWGLTTLAATPASPLTATAFLVGSTSEWPAAPFDMVARRAGAYPGGSNAEIIRVLTYNSTGVLTSTRAQGGTTARSLRAGDECYPSAFSVMSQIRSLVAPFAVARTAYVPVFSGLAGGALTSYTAAGHYLLIGHQLFYDVRCDITTNGPAASALTYTLPLGLLPVVGQVHIGKEELVTGAPLEAYLRAANNVVLIHEMLTGSYPGGNGRRIVASGQCEVS